jgi:hypothetical protein
MVAKADAIEEITSAPAASYLSYPAEKRRLAKKEMTVMALSIGGKTSAVMANHQPRRRTAMAAAAWWRHQHQPAWRIVAAWPVSENIRCCKYFIGGCVRKRGGLGWRRRGKLWPSARRGGVSAGGGGWLGVAWRNGDLCACAGRRFAGISRPGQAWNGMGGGENISG